MTDTCHQINDSTYLRIIFGDIYCHHVKAITALFSILLYASTVYCVASLVLTKKKIRAILDKDSHCTI